MQLPSLSAIAHHVLRSRLGRDPILAMQTRGAGRHLDAQVYRVYRYHAGYGIMQQTLDMARDHDEEATWRDVTRRLWDSYWWRSRSLARVSHDNVALLATATRIRLAMQRFARALRRLVQRARRRVRQRLG